MTVEAGIEPSAEAGSDVRAPRPGSEFTSALVCASWAAVGAGTAAGLAVIVAESQADEFSGRLMALGNRAGRRGRCPRDGARTPPACSARCPSHGGWRRLQAGRAECGRRHHDVVSRHCRHGCWRCLGLRVDGGPCVGGLDRRRGCLCRDRCSTTGAARLLATTHSPAPHCGILGTSQRLLRRGRFRTWRESATLEVLIFVRPGCRVRRTDPPGAAGGDEYGGGPRGCCAGCALACRG